MQKYGFQKYGFKKEIPKLTLVIETIKNYGFEQFPYHDSDILLFKKKITSYPEIYSEIKIHEREECLMSFNRLRLDNSLEFTKYFEGLYFDEINIATSLEHYLAITFERFNKSIKNKIWVILVEKGITCKYISAIFNSKEESEDFVKNAKWPEYDKPEIKEFQVRI